MAKRRRKIKKRFMRIFLIVFILLLVIVCFNWDNIYKLIHKEETKYLFNEKEEAKNLQIFDVNSNTRPIAVMINNHGAARPYHSGLQDAYLVYEIIVEGGYTRLMAIFKDANLDRIGSVRSARHYFLDYALENDAVYVHWGWSEQAQQDISSLGVNNLNGLYAENLYFYRDKNINVAYEHTGYTNSELINKAISNLDYRNTTSKDMLLNYSVDSVSLKDMEGAIPANKVSISYSGIVNTSYEYDSNEKVYKRKVNDVEHVDYVTKKQYTTKNIITYQVSNYTLAGDVKGRQDLDNIGTGKGYYISEGYAVPIIWTKKSRTSQTEYKYLDGKEITVNDGNTYIQIQPLGRSLIIE